MTKNTRSAALREIDAAEANLVKAENLMRKISAAIPLPTGRSSPMIRSMRIIAEAFMRYGMLSRK